jgi:hypothetical protein
MRIAAREFAMIGAKPAVEAAYRRVGGAPGDPMGGPYRALAERPVWLLLYREVKMPVIGPLETTTPEVNLVDFLVYVDGRTGAVPRAQTLAPEGADGP